MGGIGHKTRKQNMMKAAEGKGYWNTRVMKAERGTGNKKDHQEESLVWGPGGGQGQDRRSNDNVHMEMFGESCCFA